ncbi:MAG: glucosamine-6-phosphate deaminase [Flavisolibacter sp.]
MEIFIETTYADLSSKIASDLISSLKLISSPLICAASGDSPIGFYKELEKKVENNELDVSSWKFVGLDEWVGMNEKDEGSCQWHLNHQLFHPLKITENRICFFNGKAKDLDDECNKTEKFIQDNGGITLAITGLGLNGHIGMNEPFTLVDRRSHKAAIAPITQQSGQKYFTRPTRLTHGITLGIANLMEAKNVFLIACGAHKAEIVKKILENEISNQLPASLFREHPGFKVYLDKAAAQLISG